MAGIHREIITAVLKSYLFMPDLYAEALRLECKCHAPFRLLHLLQ